MRAGCGIVTPKSDSHGKATKVYVAYFKITSGAQSGVKEGAGDFRTFFGDDEGKEPAHQ